jgi:hypothetical protein
MTPKDKIITAIIFGLFVCAIFYFMPGKKGNADITKTEIKKLNLVIDSLQTIVNARIDTIEIIKTQKRIVKKYYENISTKADTFKSDTALVAYIRGQLKSLGSAKFQ